MEPHSESRQPEPVQAQVVSTPAQQPVLIVQSRSGFGRFVSWLGWVAFFICLPILIGMSVAYRDYYDTTYGIRERYHSGARDARSKIAIIHVSGVIGVIDDFVKHQIDRVREDAQVKAVVLRVDSPGGTITGSDYIYHHLRKLREERELPMVVSMGGVAASGGYYVSMAVGDTPDAIFAEPTTTTGSIGVIIPHYDISGLLESWNIKDTSLATDPRKQILSITRPMSDEDREILERYLNQAFDRFKHVVRYGRPELAEEQEALERVATGEFFAAPRALELGLVDKIGFIEEAIERAAELASVDLENVRVVQFDPPVTLLGALTGSAQAPSPPRGMLNNLWQSATPRAYYLWTLLPPFFAVPQ